MAEPLYRRGDHYAAQHAEFTADLSFYRTLVQRFGDPVLELAEPAGSQHPSPGRVPGWSGREFDETLTMRIFFPRELRSLLTAQGFEIETVYGDFDFSAFDSSAPQQLVVAGIG